MENHASSRLGDVQGWLSIIINCLLFALKYITGIMTGSVSIVSDAWHTLSDSLSSVILLLGMKISRKPADREHPFGHGRAELVASVIIGILLAMVAVECGKSAFERMLSAEQPRFSNFAVWVIVLSILVKEGIAQYAFYVWRKTGLTVVKADGWHHRSDAISSLAVLAGIWLTPFFPWIDAALGLLIALPIALSSWTIIMSAVKPLLGESPSKEMIARIQDLARQEPYPEMGVHHFHIHRYGQHVELTFHLRLQGDLSLKEASGIAHRLEDDVRAALGCEVTIHIET